MTRYSKPFRPTMRKAVKGLRNADGAIQITLRDLDDLWLFPVEPLGPDQIKKIREMSHVSQAVFAKLLNTSISTVQKWEIGQKKPAGTALKLLSLVKKRGLEVIV